jgi:hypothetical protein
VCQAYERDVVHKEREETASESTWKSITEQGRHGGKSIRGWWWRVNFRNWKLFSLKDRTRSTDCVGNNELLETDKKKQIWLVKSSITLHPTSSNSWQSCADFCITEVNSTVIRYYTYVYNQQMLSDIDAYLFTNMFLSLLLPLLGCLKRIQENKQYKNI